MKSRPIRYGLATLVLAIFAAPRVEAEGIIAGTMNLTGTAIQDITLNPGTLFNPGTSAVTLDNVSGFGTITINYNAEDISNTISFASISGGMFAGSYNSPYLPGSYVFGNVPPLTGSDFSGMITNVVQNPSDPGFPTGQPSSFQSGDFSLGGNSFGFTFTSGPAMGITLLTDPSTPFSFSSTFDGLPPSTGTVLESSGTDAIKILFGTEVIGYTSDRRIVIGPAGSVPEPSGLILLGMGVLGLSACVRKSRTR
jgi:PEP-CTERM motif